MTDDTVRLPLSAITIAPERFQFKSNVDEGGVTNELKGVTRWEPDAEGVSSVWRDPKDRKTYMVNGHHRYELALRLGQPDLRCRYLDAKTATAARTRGALINIREGRGTALDAAKVFRDATLGPQDLEDQGISTVRGTLARDGLALANLHPSLFYEAVKGTLETSRAVIIGRELPEHADQLAVRALLEKKGDITDSTLAELIRQTRLAGRTTEEQRTLFGVEVLKRNLALERAEIGAYIRDRLLAERRTFGFVGESDRIGMLEDAGNQLATETNRARSTAAAQLLELYDKLSGYQGPIADVLRTHAARLRADDRRVTLRDAYAATVRELLPILCGRQPEAPPDLDHECDRALRVLRSKGALRGTAWRRQSGLETKAFRAARRRLLQLGAVRRTDESTYEVAA